MDTRVWSGVTGSRSDSSQARGPGVRSGSTAQSRRSASPTRDWNVPRQNFFQHRTFKLHVLLQQHQLKIFTPDENKPNKVRRAVAPGKNHTPQVCGLRPHQPGHRYRPQVPRFDGGLLRGVLHAVAISRGAVCQQTHVRTRGSG